MLRTATIVKRRISPFLYTFIAIFILLVLLQGFFSKNQNTILHFTLTVPTRLRDYMRRDLSADVVSVEEKKLFDAVLAQNTDPLPNSTSEAKANEMCESPGSSDECLPKFLKSETRIRSSARHKMLHCLIQKSMSTIMDASMCFLHDEVAFLKANRTLYTEYKKDSRFCRPRNEFSSLTTAMRVHKIQKSDGWNIALVTRDPVERFISGFIDRCIRFAQIDNPCNGCNFNLTCFVETEYQRLMSQVASRRLANTFEDHHFYPQNWRCELSKYYDKYSFIRYSSDPNESFLPDFLEIAMKQNVSIESIEYLRSNIGSGRTYHSTVQAWDRVYLEKRLRNSRYLMEYLVKMFYYDFILFKYPFPEGF